VSPGWGAASVLSYSGNHTAIQRLVLRQDVICREAFERAIAHLDAIALSASIALKAFERKVPGGEAKPEVWTNWPDFSKRMNELAQNTSQAAKTAREKGKETALGNILDALTCKGCHDTYREEKKH